MRAWWDRALAHVLDAEGSTRTSALLRIGLALNVWGRFGGQVGLWVQTTWIARLACVVFYVASACMLIGLWTRTAVAATAACVIAFSLAWPTFGGNEGWTHHHIHLLAVALALCALLPSGRSYSLDRWRALRRAARRGEAPPEERGPLWGLRLIVLQLSVMYLFAAYDKTTLGFLSGDRMEHYFLWYYWGSESPEVPGLGAFFTLSAIGNVTLEYALAFGLPFARTRRYLIVPGLALHAIFYVCLPVMTYSSTVWCLYLAYLDPERVHATLETLAGRPRAPA
jgi:uncharacterized membrane protein YidH (DUF202 family)